MRIFLILLIGVLLAPSVLFAQDYRELGSVSPISIYQQILSSAQAQDNSGILKSLDSLSDILNAINTNFGKDIRSEVAKAISTGKKEEVLNAVYNLVLYDMRDVFRVSIIGIEEKLSLSKLKERLKFAYLDYLLISPEVRKKNFNLDRETRKLFEEVLVSGLAVAVSEGDAHNFKRKLEAIENNYKTAFRL